MSKAEVLAKNLTKSGYGDGYTDILEILSKLTDEEIESLTYNCYRTAEKCGEDAFDCKEVFNWG